MYVSHLLVDTGDNPDHPRPGRAWLRDAYAVHRRLCLAYPSPERLDSDPFFLLPYAESSFRTGQVHVPRGEAGFLFRIDPVLGGGAVITVQSAARPQWDYAFKNAAMLLKLKAPPAVHVLQLALVKGERYQFRILLNLSQKISKRYMNGEDLRRECSVGALNKAGKPKSQGKRALLVWPDKTDPAATIRPWFEMKAGVRKPERRDGYIVEGELLPDRPFTLEDFALVKLGWVLGFKPHYDTNGSPPKPGPNFKVQHDRLSFRSALLEGVLRVEDAQAFRTLALGGIGAGKAFGFGLLSLRRIA